MSATAGSLIFDVLGPLEVRRFGQSVPLGPPQRRRLLLRLLVAGPAPVQRSQLIEDIWGDRPTPGNLSSLHAHVSRLRSALEPGVRRPAVLVREGSGYLLHVDPSMLSSVRFEESIRRTRRLLAIGRSEAARAEVEAAMSWWRGAALADVADAPFARGLAGRLEEARLSAEEMRIATLLAVGDCATATASARALVDGHPLRESAWELLIKSLYRSGRAAEALQQYDRIRAALVDELGTEPGPALRKLHLAVLRQDIQLDSGAAAAVPSGDGAGSAGAAVPIGATPLVGREWARSVLARMLVRTGTGRTTWAVVSGAFGLGKSALMEQVAVDATAGGWDVVVSRPVALPGAGPELTVDRLASELAGPAPTAALEAPTGHPGPPVGVADQPADSHGRSSDPRDIDALVARVAQRCARRHTVWIVEDIDLLDSAARAFLGRLAVGLRSVPLTVICTVRNPDGPPVGELTLLLTRSGAERIALEPLTVRDVARLAGVADGTALARRTGGNPFLVRAVLSLPADARLGRVPPAALSAFRAVLRDLPARTRLLLRSLADLRYLGQGDGDLRLGRGPQVDAAMEVGLIARTAGVSTDLVDDLLMPAVEAGVMSRVDGWPVGYAFASTLLSDALADRLV
ncbi:BTAD domain-containing putative transcriptional regulator [Solwaraspora sp. WMMD791]|uniref:BTAD domain-containing putative transcriptional regulator n=1 Tax=Solwaraspora sp. WMMD791 TaxID=3016086 RepID=UPI00249A0EB6|nr:BTAD domain-containing putative transcriptional regulator [Solwaraspora sp. WMMD791]WFE27083.1 BTAD domain-containing putative transcriptional regulator [Solwaraspora sp. WMMD791]